jgi:hypothetical protein
MSVLRCCMLAALVAWAGCGGDGAGTDGGLAADADPLAPDADPLAPDAGAGIDGGGEPALAVCQLGCTTASDCGQATAAYDADNYECDQGVCVWTGCNSTAECTETFQSQNYVCAVRGELALPSCYPTCSAPADCVLGDSSLYDADNYACDQGACVWTGCNSSPECVEGLADPDALCRDDLCWPGCQTVADCVLPGALYDGDNYECDQGACRWTGCNSTAECTDTLMNPDYVCTGA